MKVTRRSPLTGEDTTLDLPVTQEQLDEMERPIGQRRLVQQIFPGLTTGQREFIKTGYTEEDWAQLFEQEDSDDEA